MAEDQSLPRSGIGRSKYWIIVPNSVTAAAVFCAFYSVVESLKGFQCLTLNHVDASAQHFDLAALSILWGFLFDNLDGRLARMVKVTSEFGKEFDSLADALTFGMAPMVLVYGWCYGSSVPMQNLLLICTFVFVLCGAVRLARFNVQSHKPPDKNARSQPITHFFVGMPIPIAAFLIASIVHFSPVPLSMRPGHIQLLGHSIPVTAAFVLMLVLLLALALLMVSTVPYYSFKGFGGNKLGIWGSALVPGTIVLVILSGSPPTVLAMGVFLALMGPLFLFGTLLRPGKTNMRSELVLPAGGTTGTPSSPGSPNLQS